MGWRNAYRIAQISITLFPGLAGARFPQWHQAIKNWRRPDLKLWRSHCVHYPTLEEISLAASLASELTKDHRVQFERERRQSAINQMTGLAYRLLDFPGE